MINKLCFYIALINYIVFYSKTKGLKFHFWMSQGKALYQFEESDPLIPQFRSGKLFYQINILKLLRGGYSGQIQNVKLSAKRSDHP